MATFTDNFTRANEQPLNPTNWSTFPGFNQGDPILAIISDQCVAQSPDSNQQGAQQFTGFALPANQFVQVTVGATSGNISAFGMFGRCDNGGNNNIISVFFGPGESTSFGTFTFDIFASGSQVQQYDGNFNTTVTTGDVIRLEMVGTLLTLKQNGSTVFSQHDSNVTNAGQTALYVEYGTVQTDTSVAAFSTGSLGSTPTSGTIAYGQLFGSSLQQAVTNPQGLDILQVVNEGGKVVWNLDHNGNANTNPVSPTATGLQRYFGSSFSSAFDSNNPDNLDILQVIGQGGGVVFHVDYQGNAG